MLELLHHIGENFNQYLIVLLLIVLFFKESLMSIIHSKLGTTPKIPTWGVEATEKINRLTEYANHDTTERLEKLIKMEESEHQSMQEFHDSIKDMARTLNEIKEYGIPCREKKQ